MEDEQAKKKEGRIVCTRVCCVCECVFGGRAGGGGGERMFFENKLKGGN